MPQSQFEVAYHVFPGKGDYKTGTYFQVMDYHEHDIGVSDAWKPVAKKEMVNVNVMAMRKNLNSFSLLLTEQVVKEPAVVEEEEQLVLADLRVVIVGTAITAMTVIMMYIVHWGTSGFYQRTLGD